MTRILFLFLGLPLAGCLQGVLTGSATASGSTGSVTTGSSGSGATTTGGGLSSGLSCRTSSDCGGATPCCEFGTFVCGLEPPGGLCRCSTTSECDSFFGEGVDACVPATLYATPTEDVVINGPYVCVANDGLPWDGCQGTPCLDGGQYCSTDKAGNAFCSVACTSDSSCGNPGVACCNAGCMDGGRCCGVCGSGTDGGACETSTDCGGATPCCSFSGNCITAPNFSDTYCRCSRTSDCDFLTGGQECVPEVRNKPPNQLITGPYSCVPDLGGYSDGCHGKTCVAGESCSTDKAGNEFCSKPCTSDSSCNNPSVACCNAACPDGGKCCGLCGS